MITNTTNNLKSNIFVSLIILFIRLFVSYIKYYFLTGSIIFPLVSLLFIIMNLNPDFSFAFLVEYFSFLNPLFKNESFTLGTKEIMEIISVVTLFFWFIIAVIKLVIKKIFKINIDFSLKFKILSFFVVVSLIYIFDFVVIVLNDSLDNSFFIVFIFFYILNIGSVLGYFLVDFLSKKFTNYNVVE